MIVLFVEWFASDVFEEIALQGDMKLQFISAVAAFLLCLVIAERNGPTNSQLTSRRRFNKSYRENQSQRGSGRRSIMNATDENPKIAGRLPSTFKVMGISKTRKISQRKFPGMITPKSPFANTRRYARGQRSETKTPRKFSATKFHQARRSLDLGIKSHHLPGPKIIDEALFLEPILYQKAKAGLFGHPTVADFSPDLNDILGPVIGPFDLPGIGRSVHIRLIVPPDEEAASHVTVHLVNKGPENFDIDESPGFGHPEKPKPYFSGEKPVIFSPIPPEKLSASIPANSQRSRPVDGPVYTPGVAPPEANAALRPFRDQNHPEIPQNIPNNGLAQFGNPQQYFAAPNHHQLPLAVRPVENLTNLPIYPPLFAQVYKGEKSGGKMNEANVSAADTQTGVETPGDTRASASSKRIIVYRNHLAPPTAWRAIRAPVLPESEVTSNRRESPAPVFVQEITPPDLRSGDVSRREFRDEVASSNGREYASRDLRLRNNSAVPAAREDRHLALDASDYSSGHTTTPRTSHLSSHHTRPGEYDTDDHDGELRSTTSNVELTDDETDPTTLTKMERIR